LLSFKRQCKGIDEKLFLSFDRFSIVPWEVELIGDNMQSIQHSNFIPLAHLQHLYVLVADKARRVCFGINLE
jgi:hypothetical protein